MSNPTDDDISIDKDKWINFVNLDGREDEVVRIDKVLKPISKFLDLIETDCVADCCGIDAFGFWPGQIIQASSQLADNTLIEKVRTIRDWIENNDGNTFVSRRLSNYFDKQVLLQLFNHLLDCLRN